MMRKLLSVLLTLVILISAIPLTVTADIEPPATLGAPEHFGVGKNNNYGNSVRYTFGAPEDLRAYIEKRAADDPDNKQTLLVRFQIDYKIDGGSWHHTPEWDSPKTAPKGISDRYFVFANGKSYNNTSSWSMTEFFPEEEDLKLFEEAGWDFLKSHSITFRARFAHSFDNSDTYVLSPWSKEFILSANAKADYNKLINHAPTLVSADVKIAGGGEPYFEVKLGRHPGEIQDLSAMASGYMRTEIWMRRAGDKDFKYIHYEWANCENFEIEASDYFDGETQSYDAEGYEIKVRYALDLRNYKQSGHDNSSSSVDIYGPFSNVISHNMPAWSEASQWATGELKKADEAGLIPDILKGADLTKPITREEFAELAVKLYEKTTGTAAIAASPNPFTDTNNPEILKAFKLGVTTGTSATTFSPVVLINREQCAAMLFRTIKAIHSGGAYSVAGIPDFPDQKDISAYAVEAAKYMSNLGIVKGDMKGNFMPKAITDAQTAAGYGMATREAAILMSVRSFEQMDAIKGSKASSSDAIAPAAPAQPVTESGSIVGKWGKGIAGATYNIITGSFDFGIYGTEEEYQFNSDGTYTELIKTGSGSVISITGNYTVSGGMITFTYKESKSSSDYGKTWKAGNTRQPVSYYYELGKDSDGRYLTIGLEGATPPLDTETNAVRYWFRQ